MTHKMIYAHMKGEYSTHSDNAVPQPPKMNLQQYLKADKTATKRIAEYAHTTEDAILEIALGQRKPSKQTCWRIYGATHGAVTIHDLRPDLDNIRESCCCQQCDCGDYV
jgi:hypothetical protein